MGAVRLYAAAYKSSNAKMIKNHLNKDDEPLKNHISALQFRGNSSKHLTMIFFFDKNL
jgi:hypothetical protein